METNVIYRGDCLKIMANPENFPDRSVDMIYCDPPFFTQKQYELIWPDDAYEVRAFDDRWSGGIQHYINYMEPRLRQCYRVLKDTGTLYLHCDYHANSYLRILLDRIFNVSAPRNEIIWYYPDSPGRPRRDFARKHDTILRYVKTEDYIFNDMAIRVPILEASKDRYKFPRTIGGRTYEGGAASKIGKIPEDVLRIPVVKQNSKEAIGYRTQKPSRLIGMLIAASSNAGDIVLDPMCGCGTTIETAYRMGRRWIGIDIAATACRVMADRMRKIVPKAAGDVRVLNMPKTMEDLKQLQPFDFQNWVLGAMMGRAKQRRTGDFGIDGYLFDGTPVQVKQMEHVGRPVLDAFETALKREGKTRGIIVAFSFAKRTVNEEIARAKAEEGIEITVKTVKEVLTDE